MPVVSCPKCPTKLKIPDGVSGNTKCPKCGTVFPVQAQAPAKVLFEVVDEAPAQKPSPVAKSAPKPVPEEPDFEVLEDEKPKKRVTDDDDDDEPRSRKKQHRDDDDDDEPRSRKKKRNERGRKKKRYYNDDDDDDDDDDDWRPRGGGGGGGRSGEFAKGRTGAQLLAIAFWLNLGSYGLLTLYALIAWIMANSSSGSSPSSPRSGGGDDDGSFLDVMVILPGLIGLGSWIVGIVGCSFSIAGPRKARGMAITATVFAALHLLLTAVTFANMQDGIGAIGRSVPGLGKAAWIFVASTLPALDLFLPMLFYQSKVISSDYIFALLAAVCEGGRLIFAVLTLKGLAAAARDYEVAERCHISSLLVSFVLGGVMVFSLLIVIVLREGGFKSLSTYMNLGLATVFIMYLAYTIMMLSPALVAGDAKYACARRS